VRESVRQPVRYFSRPSGKEVDVENGGEAGGRADRQVSGGAWSVERGAWSVACFRLSRGWIVGFGNKLAELCRYRNLAADGCALNGALLLEWDITRPDIWMNGGCDLPAATPIFPEKRSIHFSASHCTHVLIQEAAAGQREGGRRRRRLPCPCLTLIVLRQASYATSSSSSPPWWVQDSACIGCTGR
jgi:hypothetical protein